MYNISMFVLLIVSYPNTSSFHFCHKMTDCTTIIYDTNYPYYYQQFCRVDVGSQHRSSSHTLFRTRCSSFTPLLASSECNQFQPICITTDRSVAGGVDTNSISSSLQAYYKQIFSFPTLFTIPGPNLGILYHSG